MRAARNEMVHTDAVVVVDGVVVLGVALELGGTPACSKNPVPRWELYGGAHRPAEDQRRMKASNRTRNSHAGSIDLLVSFDSLR